MWKKSKVNKIKVLEKDVIVLINMTLTLRSNLHSVNKYSFQTITWWNWQIISFYKFRMSIWQKERANSHSKNEKRKWDGGDKSGSEGEPCNKGWIRALSDCCSGRSGQHSEGEREGEREGRNKWEAQRGKQGGGISTMLENPTHQPRLWMHLWHRFWGILRGLRLTCTSETKTHGQPTITPSHHHQHKTCFCLLSARMWTAVHRCVPRTANSSPAGWRCPTRAHVITILECPCIEKHSYPLH